ncbi:hypothetical protein [Paraliomyxa miuraensis]|uniref:hypothetical protein n=1 Tax=Paraliomyxa miuraensis TaxID=376150 RepID=UPI0022593FC6|nr:hypothetical protein [Paraliomyxa miuraensis]MCX4241777.1 hypothetical protein [Paraliomyxa miuraensis]
MKIRTLLTLVVLLYASLIPDAHAAGEDDAARDWAEKVNIVAQKLRRACIAPELLEKDAVEVRRHVILNQLKALLGTEGLEAAKRDAIAKAIKSNAKVHSATSDELDGLLEDLALHAPSVVAYDATLQAQLGTTSPLIDTNARKSLCDALCTRGGTAAGKLDFCALEDPTLATAAALADPDSLRAVLSHIEHQLDEEIAKVRLDVDPLETLGDVSPLVDLSTALGGARNEDHGLSGMAGISATQIVAFLDTAAQALAKVIIDRAKREAIGWMLDTMATEVCSHDSADTWLRSELARHWLPSLCTLATEERASHYGAGAAQLQALRSAIETDLEGMPGAALGLLLGHFFFETALRPTLVTQSARPSAAPTSVLQCNDHATEVRYNDYDLCEDAVEVRRATEAATRSIMRGGDPRIALDELATALDRINVARGVGHEGLLESPSLQVVACAISLGRYAGVEPDRATVLAGLVESPACWTLTGQGYPSMTEALAATTAPSKVLAIDARFTGKDPEQLTTLIGLHTGVDQPTQQIVRSASDLAKAASQLLGATPIPGDDPPDGKAPTQPPLPSFDGAKSPTDVAQAARSYLDATLSAQLRIDRTKAFDAIADMLEASTSMGTATVDLLERARAKELLPGLRHAALTAGTALGSPTDVTTLALAKLLSRARAQLAHLGELSEVVRASGSAEWGRLANQGLRMLSEVLAELRAKHGGAASTATVEVEALMCALDRVGRHLGTLVAIASAQSSDDMAKALDDAANPPGGWKRKLGHGNRTISLTAHAGLMAAAELRHGSYGVTFERWGWHAQAPTLFLPFGVEAAFGLRHTALAVFIPLIDPAAFLGYDVQRDGRLPGPNPLTVLSPGLGLRAALGRTPFGVMLFGVFRPKYRAWEPTVNGPGAHAIQLGLALTVDVTLFRLFSKGR